MKEIFGPRKMLTVFAGSVCLSHMIEGKPNSVTISSITVKLRIIPCRDTSTLNHCVKLSRHAWWLNSLTLCRGFISLLTNISRDIPKPVISNFKAEWKRFAEHKKTRAKNFFSCATSFYILEILNFFPYAVFRHCACYSALALFLRAKLFPSRFIHASSISH